MADPSPAPPDPAKDEDATSSGEPSGKGRSSAAATRSPGATATTHASVVAEAQATTPTSRHYLAVQHLRFAKINARLCEAREKRYTGKKDFDFQHRAYATSAIMMSVAFLEALVNEVYIDALDRADGNANERIAPLDEDAGLLMAEFWRTTEGARRHVPVLDKYQTALRLAKIEPFSRGEVLFQDAERLVALRNALVHFKPETQEHGVETKFEKNFKGRFEDNQLVPETHPWFPSRALGAGAAAWACRTSRKFASEWVIALGIDENYRNDSIEYRRP